MIGTSDRRDGALLAGVCASIARSFKWNVWVLRALFIGFLLIKTLAAVLVYAGLALLQHLVPAIQGKSQQKGLRSPELSTHDKRIEELDRRFRKMEERRNRAN